MTMNPFDWGLVLVASTIGWIASALAYDAETKRPRGAAYAILTSVLLGVLALGGMIGAILAP